MYLSLSRVTLAILLAFTAIATIAAPAYIWREGETPDDATFQWKTTGGTPALVSGTFLNDSLSKDELKAGKLKTDHIITYGIDVGAAGEYTLWFRSAFEFARSPYDWRLNGGAWSTVSPKMLGVDLVQLWNWGELAWVKAGTIELPAGKHTLEICTARVGQQHAILFGMDALLLVQGDWVPANKIKPGEELNSTQDTQAAAQVYRFTKEQTQGIPATRASLPLHGLWQVTRHDDADMDTGTYEPVRDLPAQPHWYGISVPSDLWSLPACKYAHRVIYRTKVEVPATFAGRSFILDFSGTNWIASVIVNGQFVGSRKSTRIPWQCDISTAIKPGQVNEICIGIKSAWYAIDANTLKTTIDERRNVPRDEQFLKWTKWVAPIWPSSKGDADGTVSGITDPIHLVVSGKAYVESAFIQTSVAKHIITADIKVKNPTKDALEISVGAVAIFEGNGKAEKTLLPVTVTVPAGDTQTVTLTAPWTDAKLWWPDQDPANLYRLRITLAKKGTPLDTFDQRFGFRELTVDGTAFRVNGLRRNYWNLLHCIKGGTPEEALAHYKQGNNRFERFGEDLRLKSLLGPMEAQLDWFDTHGIPGRLSTMIDGMFINYNLENPLVWQNFREHIEQVVVAYRNHPSVVMYSLENELMLINGSLIYGGKMPEIEANAKQHLYDVAKTLDPTRPAMLDGAGAMGGNLLEINSMHYPEVDKENYPDHAYTLKSFNDFSTGKGRWAWDHQRPLVLGETAGFGGDNGSTAWIGGDAVFQGRDISRGKAYAQYLRSLFEGYRWADVAVICPWNSMDETPDAWISMAPLAAFVREYNTRFFSEQSVTRTVKVFNDTFSTAPIKFTWKVIMNGKPVAEKSMVLTIEPGFAQAMPIAFKAPQVKERTSVQFVLEVTQPGSPAFKDVKEYVIIPALRTVTTKRPVYVLDNVTDLATRLRQWGMNIVAIKDITEATEPNGIILVGHNQVQPKQPLAPFVAYAKAGGRVVFLEQETPIAGTELPSPVNVAMLKNSKGVPTGRTYNANYAFPQGIGTAMFAGIESTDLCLWSGDTPTATKVWEKPTGAVRSWIECGDQLNNSALIEVPCGQGNILAIQLRVGAKLAVEPAAQLLLANLLRRADQYAPPTKSVAIYAPDRAEIVKLITDLGCQRKIVETLDAALDAQGNPILVIHASKANLEGLLARKTAVTAYNNAGGWIMLWGLEPEGLVAYNQLLGTQHLLREFRMERVYALQDPMMAGLGNRDVAQYGTNSPAPWSGDKWLSQDVFTYCVDGADIAPFCKLPGQKDEPYTPRFDDSDPYNFVNGMTSEENWRYIRQIWAGDWPKAGSPPFNFTLPVPCNINAIKVWNNAFYDTIKDIEVQCDDRKVAILELPDAAEMRETVLGGAAVKEKVSLIVRSFRTKPQVGPLVGIDNVQIIRELPDWYPGRVSPMVNVNGLVRYPIGDGGFLLNQVKLTTTDTKENSAKKQRLVSVLLQNLGAAF